MSKEIRINESIRISNGFIDNISPGQVTYDQASPGGGNPATVNIGTSEEDVAFGDVTPGFLWMQNLDTTNYVQYGPKNASNAMQPFGLLHAGKTARIYLDTGVTLRMKAHTGACNVLIKGYNV